MSSSGDPVKRPELARAATEYLERKHGSVQFHILSGVSNQEVPIWLNASDVVLLTSRHEGSPNIIKEALACNLPVVSIDVGDVRERIQGVEGCYLALPDPSDLAAKLHLVHGGRRRVEGRVQMQELSLEQIGLLLKRFYIETLMSARKQIPARFFLSGLIRRVLVLLGFLSFLTIPVPANTYDVSTYDNSSSRAFASRKSIVSNPSVNLL